MAAFLAVENIQSSASPDAGSGSDDSGYVDGIVAGGIR